MISIERFFKDNGHLFIFNRKGTKNFRDLQIIMLFLCAKFGNIQNFYYLCAKLRTYQFTWLRIQHNPQQASTNASR